MKPKTYAYIAGSLMAAVIVTVVGWVPPVKGDSNQTPVFAVDASWPQPLPAPVGTDGIAHAWVQGEVAASCIDSRDNVYTFNRGWEVGVTFNGVLQGNQSGAINGNDATAGGAIPSPPVVAFDFDGNTIAGWGNPSLIQPPAGDYGYAAYMSSRPADFHRRALPDPYVNLSIHTAPDVRAAERATGRCQ